jgi:hypothetical protein
MAGGTAGKRGRRLRPALALLALGLALDEPAAAETAEEDFLWVAPLPEGVEAVGPIPGAVNVHFRECEAVWPDGYRAWLAESVAAEGHARKRDIYSWLRAWQAFETKDCGCAGKVAPWEEVDRIFAALRQAHGRVEIKHTAVFASQADVLTAAVERMCGGPF